MRSAQGGKGDFDSSAAGTVFTEAPFGMSVAKRAGTVVPARFLSGSQEQPYAANACNRRRRAKATRAPQAKIKPGNPAPTTGPGTALKPTKVSGPSFDGRQPAGAPAAQPSVAES